jgi:hypothetical protein
MRDTVQSFEKDQVIKIFGSPPEFWKTQRFGNSSTAMRNRSWLSQDHKFYVKEQLGHSSIKFTADTYAHLIPGGNRQAVDQLDDDGNILEPRGYECAATY